MRSASSTTHLQKSQPSDRKILEQLNKEQVMKSYLMLHDQLIQIYHPPRNIITSADPESEENINAIGVCYYNLAVSIVKI